MTTFALSTGVSTLVIALALSDLCALQLPVVAQARRLDATALLNTYALGRHDDALAAVRRVTPDSIRDLRQQIVLTGSQWVDEVEADRRRRALAAAAFVLETERIRAERGEWAALDEQDCAGRCMIEWACTLLGTGGVADEGERLWMLASVALAGGVRDWSFLHSPLAPPSARTRERGHAHHAQDRLPDEPRFRLARAVAIASRTTVTDEMDTPRAGTRTGPLSRGIVSIIVDLESISPAAQRRAALLEYAKEQFAGLVSDPAVGDEARIRLGYLQWASGDVEQALATQRAAADAAEDPDLRYVANFLAAQAEQTLGDLSSAETHYAAALTARPGSQSATLGLAALLYLRGEARRAYEVVEASRSGRPRDDDPWRTFLYGDFAKLPALVGELRRRVSP
jgi:hypothetical protein